MGLSLMPSPRTLRGSSASPAFPARWAARRCRMWAPMGRRFRKLSSRYARSTGKRRQFVDLPASDCGFSYRRSIFNSSQRERYVVSRVDYALRKDAPANFVYADVARYFAARNVAAPTLAEVRDAVRSIRAQKGMLLVPGDADCRSAGSFFKNPVVPASTLDSLALELRVEKQSIPAYPAQDRAR